MRSPIFHVLFAALVGAAPMTYAEAGPAATPAARAVSTKAHKMANPLTGVVKSIDMKTHWLTLTDGAMFKLPKTFDEPTVKAGSKVAVTWKKAGKHHSATRISVVG